MLMRAATVVQVLHGLFYVLLQLLVVAAIILSFKFYCKFYCSCDPSLRDGVGKIREKYFRAIILYIRAFSGKYHVKFGHFVNFSYIIFGQKCLAPKVD